MGQLGLQAGAVVITAGTGCGQRHSGLQLHPCHRRVEGHTRQTRSGVGRETHHHRLEVHQQRVGGGVVGAGGFTVELGWVVGAGCKGRSVQHDVARDGLDAQALQAAQQQPQPLHHQGRVTLALDVHVTGEGAVLQLAVQGHRGVPGEGGAELVECGVGGNQLHHRRRIDRHVGAVAGTRCAALGIHHQHRQRVFGQLGAGQCGLHFRRQAGLGQRGAGGGQQGAAGEGCREEQTADRQHGAESIGRPSKAHDQSRIIPRMCSAFTTATRAVTPKTIAVCASAVCATACFGIKNRPV